MEILLADYGIHIAPISETLPAVLARKAYSQLLILTDENCYSHCLPYLLRAVPAALQQTATVIVIAPGELYKNIDTCNYIWRQLLAAKADRAALLLNLGGGVVGDMGGFAAATYKRGIDFVQIPTTLLAQVDASVGGKLGIDFEGVKNAVGVFRNPQAVLIDDLFLQTLPYRHWKNGMAEMFKHALIGGSPATHWDALCHAIDPNTHIAAMHNNKQQAPINNRLIAQSIQIKKDIVSQDPYEQGVRKVLNFGHTIGHAIESLSLQHDLNPLLHGEAIGLGMLAELQLSVQYANMPDGDAAQATALLQQLFPPTYKIANPRKSEFWDYLYNDKKNKNGQLKFSLLKKIGIATYDVVVSREDIEKTLYALSLF